MRRGRLRSRVVSRHGASNRYWARPLLALLTGAAVAVVLGALWWTWVAGLIIGAVWSVLLAPSVFSDERARHEREDTSGAASS